MPVATTAQLQAALPNTSVFLMYGLTEAFRSTFLPHRTRSSIDRNRWARRSRTPTSWWCARTAAGATSTNPVNSSTVAPGVARVTGATAKTDIRFQTGTGTTGGIPNPNSRSGPVTRYAAMPRVFLYFIGRNDEMIKTSGYRVSPGEIEEVVFQVPGVEQAVAFGAPPHSSATGSCWSSRPLPAVSTPIPSAHCKDKSADVHAAGIPRSPANCHAIRRQDRSQGAVDEVCRVFLPPQGSS